MANRLLRPLSGSLTNGVVKLYGYIATSTSGTISSTTGTKGMTITKTASETGRYTLTLSDKYQSLLACSVAIQGAADAAYTTAKGLTWILRGVDVSATTPVLYLQFNDPDGSAADAELEDGAKVYIELTLKNSSV